jgi:hypothetical protein
MNTYAIMARVSFETEVYVDAHNLPEAMEKLANGVDSSHEDPYDQGVTIKYEALDFVKPQVWDEEKRNYVPCNVIMFPVKDEVLDFEGED